MFDGQLQHKTGAQRALDYFKSRVETFEDVFSSLFQVRRLRGTSDAQDELLRYVHRCITGIDHPIATPEIPTYLSDLLASVDLVAGIAPRLGQKHLRMIAIDGFPRLSFPGILGTLDKLPLEYRWHTRAILLDPEEARSMLDKTRRKWRAKIRGWKDQLLRSETGPIDLYARDMASDAEEAMGVASSGDVQFCIYSTVVLCTHESLERLEEASSLVVKTIRNLGFACRVESVNAMEAWRGALPGDGYRNVRRVVLHTLNLADMLPITAVWAGSHENPSPLMGRGNASLLYAATSGATPFRFNLHVGDLGHTLMIGPPRCRQIHVPGVGDCAVVPLPARPSLRLRQGLFVVCFDASGGRRVLRHWRREDALGLLPAEGDRLSLGCCLGCGLARKSLYAAGF